MQIYKGSPPRVSNVSKRYKIVRSHTVDHMAPRTLEEHITWPIPHPGNLRMSPVLTVTVASLEHRARRVAQTMATQLTAALPVRNDRILSQGAQHVAPPKED
jgi:hypothetical protein